MKKIQYILTFITLLSCSERKFQRELAAIDLDRGEITLCGSGVNQFGEVSFNLGFSEQVKSDFNLATALLHSFEYTEAEKVFAKIIDEDPKCVMAYWGVAMANFHPLWAPPTAAELQKGAKIIALGRSLIKDKSTSESDYIEAIATIYDQYDLLDHQTRLTKFENASRKVFEKYPSDYEAAIFYALALDAAADPSDKTFKNQKEAGKILNDIFSKAPNHPGVAHYIIHNYDYPELAELALPAARKYAAIASASAHAQHMPSHIFTRLGLWDEAIASNINSVDAATCYAQGAGMKGHWDEELHGMDYLTYAYLQKTEDEKALEQLAYLATIKEVFPVNFKCAYAFAAMPARYAVERKDWLFACRLELAPANFPWEKFLWEKANIHFARLLGAVHTNQADFAKAELANLYSIHSTLAQQNEKYKANLVLIQVKTAEGWINLENGKRQEAVKLTREAADMEDATAKHPVTPGEIIPARELLGDMLMEIGDYRNAFHEYEADLKRHPNRFNGLYGAGLAAERSGRADQAKTYYEQLLVLAGASASERPQLLHARTFLKGPS
ncbi:MAG TPA: hypothetical protein VFW11_02670 [Cyclobacteriaceae bacterium]|nr:hypothetical protein [Cyclobacteriaceae bacterium]